MIDKRSNEIQWDLVPRQQDSFVRLMNTALNAYINLLRIPFSFYQMEVNGTEAATQQAKQLARHATLQATEAATQQVRQLTEYATLQATEAATQQVKQLAEQATLQATHAATEQVKQLTEYAAQPATEQVKQLALHATLQATDAATEQVKQLAEQAALRATDAATEQVKQLAEHVTLRAMEAATEQVRQLAEQAALQVAEGARTAAQHEWEQAQIWTFEHPLKEAESHRPVRLRVNRPGIGHAGINHDGKWIRTYDVPLEEVSPDVWEAYLLDPEINEFTFIWYDPDKPGKVHWEGKNYHLPRQEKRT